MRNISYRCSHRSFRTNDFLRASVAPPFLDSDHPCKHHPMNRKWTPSYTPLGVISTVGLINMWKLRLTIEITPILKHSSIKQYISLQLKWNLDEYMFKEAFNVNGLDQVNVWPCVSQSNLHDENFHVNIRI